MSSLIMPMEKVLELIKTDKLFRASLLERDDSIIDDIYKFIGSQNCPSCVAKIQNFINQNIDFINTLVTPPVTTNLSTPDKATIPRVTVSRPLTPTPIKVAGEIYEIDADPNQYKEFIELTQTQRWLYRGFVVVERINDEGKKVWLLMFY